MSDARPLIDILLADPGEAAEEVRSILLAVDSEFVPPLSRRSGPLDADLGPRTKAAGSAYIDAVLNQNKIIARVAGAAAGLISFIHDHRDERLANCCPCNYLTTLAVLPAYRGRGVARRLYRAVLHELPDDLVSPFLAGRTWSTNSGSIRLLKEFGFREVLRLKDDRGSGVDTIYFSRTAPDRAVRSS